MNTINVQKGKLLATLVANQLAHHMEYKEAIIAFRLAVIDEFELLLTAAKESKDGDELVLRVTCIKPQNYNDEYEKAIKMVEWEQSDNIELDPLEFDKYVMDEWHFTDNFNMVNATYIHA